MTSLVVQELRIHLQCRGSWLNPWLGNQDPTCRGATKPAHCSYMPQLENFLCYKRKYPHDSTKITCAAAKTLCNQKWKTNKQKQVFRKTDRWRDQHQVRTRGEFPDHGALVRYSFWTRRSLENFQYVVIPGLPVSGSWATQKLGFPPGSMLFCERMLVS